VQQIIHKVQLRSNKINKKLKPKKNLKLKKSKSKSKKNLKIKSERSHISTKTKRKQKSPSVTVLKKGALESNKIVSIDEIFTRNSIGKETNIPQGEKTDQNLIKKDLIFTQGTDFLSFIEEKEKNLAQFKETRKYDSASTLAGWTTIGNTISKKDLELKQERPFSGGISKEENKGIKWLVKRKQPFSRPKTANNALNQLEKSHEHKLSTLNPSSNEDGNTISNHLPEIIETENQNSSTDFELSSENSNDLLENSKIFEKLRRSPTNSDHKNKTEDDKILTQEKSQYNLDNSRGISEQNPLKSSRRNPCEMANEISTHISKNQNQMEIRKMKDNESYLNTQLMGSPVHESRIEKLKPLNKLKRPNSANVKPINTKDEPILPHMLCSAVGIQRNNLKLNLNSLLNSKEVQSNYVPQMIFTRPSSARTLKDIKKENAIVVVQKNMKKYLERIRIDKKKEMEGILEQSKFTYENFTTPGKFRYNKRQK